MIKKIIKIFFGIFTILILAILLAYSAAKYFSSGMDDTAEAFFKAVKAQDFATARTYLAEDFRTSTDETALKTFLAKNALVNFKEASWSNREASLHLTSASRGDLAGSITTEAGGVIPIKISFVKENDAWKIRAIQKPTAGAQPEATGNTVPTPSEQLSLIKQTMKDFAVSVNARNMTHLHGTLSQAWKKEISIEQLDQLVGPAFYGQDLSVLDGIEPTLEPATSLENNGGLILRGWYPTATPKKQHFEMKYLYEGVGWKLYGFKFTLE